MHVKNKNMLLNVLIQLTVFNKERHTDKSVSFKKTFENCMYGFGMVSMTWIPGEVLTCPVPAVLGHLNTLQVRFSDPHCEWLLMCLINGVKMHLGTRQKSRSIRVNIFMTTHGILSD
jgi:hypothetical protein